jgi:hypothetical protein
MLFGKRLEGARSGMRRQCSALHHVTEIVALSMMIDVRWREMAGQEGLIGYDKRHYKNQSVFSSPN